MLSWAFIMLVIALISGSISLSGLAGAASWAAWALFLAALFAALILLIGSHRPRVF